MKKALLTVLFISLAAVNFASAHTYKTEGTITVLMHSNPDDDPIVGQAAALFFQVTDTANKFDASKCDCNLIISKQGQELFRGPLINLDTATSIYGFTRPFTFPQKSVYSIVVSGKPVTGNLFQSFNVSYDLRVDRSPGEAPNTELSPWPWIGGGIILIGIIGIFAWKRKTK